MKQILTIIIILYCSNFIEAQNVGIGTTAPLRSFHINSGALIITGDTGTVPSLASGAKFFWSPAKSAFRAGTTTGAEWNYTNLGTSSFAFGKNSNASNSFSMAGGEGTTVSNTHSFGIGANINVTGQYAAAFGNNNTANGNYSFSTGLNNIANGIYSTTIGSNLQADSYSSLVIGRYNKIEGSNTGWVATDPVFVIGNGLLRFDGIARSNAFSVAKNGDMIAGGDATIEGDMILEGDATIEGKTILNDSLRINSSVSITDSLTVLNKIKVVNSIGIKEFGKLTSLHIGGGVSLKHTISYYDAFFGQTTFAVGDNSYISLRITNGTSPLNVRLGDGVASGQILIITRSDGAVYNFLDNSSYNLNLSTNRTIDDNDDRLGLMWNGVNWIELFFSNNN